MGKWLHRKRLSLLVPSVNMNLSGPPQKPATVTNIWWSFPVSFPKLLWLLFHKYTEHNFLSGHLILTKSLVWRTRARKFFLTKLCVLAFDPVPIYHRASSFPRLLQSNSLPNTFPREWNFQFQACFYFNSALLKFTIPPFSIVAVVQ